MAPEIKRKTSKNAATTAAAGEEMEPPIASGSRSILSDSDSESWKRFKPGTPMTARNKEPAPVPMSDSSIAEEIREARSRKKVPRVNVARLEMPAASGDPVNRMQTISRELNKEIMGTSLDNDGKLRIMEFSARYERLLIALLNENERLKGRLDEMQCRPIRQNYGVNASAVVGVSDVVSPAVNAAVSAPASKAVDTWAVVVKGKSGSTSKEVVNKVVEQVAPTLGVRLHEVRPMKDGGAVIRTPSVAEREKIATNKKFEEVGREVTVKDKLGPKIVVQKVHKAITTDEFMEDLYSMNLGDMMSKEAFVKGVRLITAPWKQEDEEGVLNVMLECTERIAEHLRVTGVYVKWFRFLVRVVDAVTACHRCYGFDHTVRNCRLLEDVCRLCGQCGHLASQCVNPVHCRNCALRRRVANHPMMSMQCPVYAAMVARANARH